MGCKGKLMEKKIEIKRVSYEPSLDSDLRWRRALAMLLGKDEKEKEEKGGGS